jgi:hypothetical protein
MARALISPNEPRTVGDKVGARVAQVEIAEFFVAEPLFWVTCNNSIVADQWAYVENKFVRIPEIVLELPVIGTPDPQPDQVIDVIREF